MTTRSPASEPRSRHCAASAPSRHPQTRAVAAASNRGGDRQANAALYRITLSRLRWDARTRDYLDHRINEGKTRREAIRCLIRKPSWGAANGTTGLACLKRYIVREIYQIITAPTSDTTERSAAA